MVWQVLGMMAARAVPTIIGGRDREKQLREAATLAAASGLAEQTNKYFAARQLNFAADAQKAAGNLAAKEEIRKSEYLQSRALAIAGASGAGVSDPDVLRVISDIAKEGELYAMNRRFEGNEASRALRVQSKLTKWEGDQAREGGRVRSNAYQSAVRSARQTTVLDILGSGGFQQGVSELLEGPNNG